MSDQHPVALRPGGPSPSVTPDPAVQQQYQSRQSVGAPISRPDSRTQQGPGGQATNFSTRFVSNQHSNQQQFPVEAGISSPRDPTANPFADHGGRSRASTASQGQNYPIAASGISSTPQAGAQPLFAQHSGTGHGQGAGSGSSRPVSRSAAISPPQGYASIAGNPMPGGSVASTRPTSAKSPFSTPITSPPRQRPYQILLINPNSTRSITDASLAAVRPTLPLGIELTGYTAPYPAPTAIESVTDAIMSTEAVLRDLAKYAASNGETVQNFDGMIIACYSKHPLIDALRESYDVPVIGIMEASMYIARMLGGRFGIVATTARSKILQDDYIQAYGMGHFCVGSEATHLGVLELETRSREEVGKRVQQASRILVAKGADTILLGCAGMTEMVRAVKDAVREEDGRRTINVVEGVEAGVQMMCTLVGMGVPTSKKGVYKGERDGRRLRGQNWL